MAPQDSFIEEDEECCPLCVEEFDLSDRKFRPCPCGYQICQFCFNNIRNNLNGLCPACRRPYSDDTIKFEVVTNEELAEFKAAAQKTAKKKQEQRQKEVQKKEVESLNRKHLSGLRVIQKNLVYVVGLSPNIPEQEILQTLRGEKYFGQYGKILKIVVSNKKNADMGPNGPSMGVYVTFANNADAQRCIAAVNGSQNGERVLRAQLGTTKYCSAYLRGETCTNKQCMFLHEPGENDDSYSRQDLSSINSINTQRPLASMSSSFASSSRQTAQIQAPVSQPQPVAASTHPMNRESSKDGSDSGDGSALPTSAHWATKGLPQRSRRGSHATSAAAPSPAVSQAVPATTEAPEEPEEAPTEQSVESSEPAPASDVAIPSTTSAKPDRDPRLMELLKAINLATLVFPSPGSTIEEEDKFPPLFDQNGGEKRRLMREHQEEARLHLEQDSQTENQSVAEPTEEEEPESGSLQLGGEPEDRDHGREGNIVQGFHNQRRPSTQLPIQRGSNGGPFGPSLTQGFPQNLGNLSSINGRTLTPQQQHQLLLMKSGQQHSSLMDQYPPGIGNQLGQGSGLFQGQGGHNRQSSRYSFANDGSSSGTSVRPSASAKTMAQQASMMPSGSHAQQSNQFYSSMPGPPPGLKSSATPPIGGMFGQNHAFGGSIGGASAFGTQKENNNDLFRDMLNGRGRGVGAGQAHDTGKREYNFPSFLQQYPSASSTPAPASSGLLASLYGPQPGAFHDFGQKQKNKKGKKHRHANTSSSGGGGLVDLADPSILQARMQHQNQSNAGVGQGLFGGQAQDDQGLPSLDEATLSVDALVADSTADDFGALSFDSYDYGSRSSTPSVPPGFGLHHAHPPSLLREDPIAKPISKIVPTSAPFTPGRSSTFIPRAATPLSYVSVPSTPAAPVAIPVTSSSKTSATLSTSETLTSQAKQDLKTLATSTGLSKAIASQAAKPALQSEDFPALDGGKGKSVVAATPAKATQIKTPAITTSKKIPLASSTNGQGSGSASKAAEKHVSAGLNISVPSKTPTKSIAAPETPSKAGMAASAFPPLPASTATSLHSPLSRTAPKTLRLTSTPKTEIPNAGIATPSSVTSTFPPTLPPSRQPSLASITRFDRPGTPTSEIISDGASITSASLSRASSPPPTKVGSAPVRMQTKSMQKKQRREAQREKERAEIEAAAAKTEPEVAIAPIMGRKKKQKKEHTIHSAAGGSTPAVSRPQTPGPVENIIEEQKSTAEVEEEPASIPEKQTPGEPSGKLVDFKGKGKGKQQRAPTPDLTPSVAEVEEEPLDKPIPTPASLFADLLSAGEIEDPNELAFFKPPVVNHRHQDPPIDMQSVNQKLTITPEDRAALLTGLAVHKIAEGPNRIMLTPNGDCVRNLTPQEEERYLDLQSVIAEESGATAFVSAKHHANNGFTLIGGRAVPNGPPSFFPTFNSSAPPIDPVSKIQRDEALSYINQYVLPSLSTNSQLEKALNANALDTDILRSGDAAAWASWGTDPAAAHPESRDGREGMLGLESMTAHFAVTGDNRGQPLGNVSLLSLSEAESAMQMARKETEGLEKRLNALIKKNRRLLLGAGH